MLVNGVIGEAGERRADGADFDFGLIGIAQLENTMRNLAQIGQADAEIRGWMPMVGGLCGAAGLLLRFSRGGGHLFRESDSDLYISKARRRCAVTGAHGLLRLALAAIRRAPKGPKFARTNRVAAIPEFGGDAAIAGILDHAAFFAAFDFPADFCGELKLVAAIVDGPGAIRFHQNRVVGIGDQIVILPRAWLQAHIGHANDWQAVPAFGAHGAAGAFFADFRGALAITEISGEKAIRNNRSALRGNAFIVVAKGAEAWAVLEARVGYYVHNLGAILQLAELVYGEKAHACEIRFLPEHAV